MRDFRIFFFNMNAKMAFSAKASIVIHVALDYAEKTFWKLPLVTLKIVYFSGFEEKDMGKQQLKHNLPDKPREEGRKSFGVLFLTGLSLV